jgi:hypothetical protein
MAIGTLPAKRKGEHKDSLGGRGSLCHLTLAPGSCQKCLEPRIEKKKIRYREITGGVCQGGDNADPAGISRPESKVEYHWHTDKDA